jgi:hypothetical protein
MVSAKSECVGGLSLRNSVDILEDAPNCQHCLVSNINVRDPITSNRGCVEGLHEVSVVFRYAAKTEARADVPSARRRRPWYTQLWAHVLTMALGIAVGHFAPALGAKMQILGDAFIKAIRVVIAPVIFRTVIHGIARMFDTPGSVASPSRPQARAASEMFPDAFPLLVR